MLAVWLAPGRGSICHCGSPPPPRSHLADDAGPGVVVLVYPGQQTQTTTSCQVSTDNIVGPGQQTQAPQTPGQQRQLGSNIDPGQRTQPPGQQRQPQVLPRPHYKCHGPSPPNSILLPTSPPCSPQPHPHNPNEDALTAPQAKHVRLPVPHLLACTPSQTSAPACSSPPHLTSPHPSPISGPPNPAPPTCAQSQTCAPSYSCPPSSPVPHPLTPSPAPHLCPKPNMRSFLFLTPARKAGTWSTDPMRSSMRSTASLAPPCSGPYSAPTAPATTV